MLKRDTQERRNQQANLSLPMFQKKWMEVSITIILADNDLRVTINEDILHLEFPRDKKKCPKGQNIGPGICPTSSLHPSLNNRLSTDIKYKKRTASDILRNTIKKTNWQSIGYEGFCIIRDFFAEMGFSQAK